MYRVELKGLLVLPLFLRRYSAFLMYRVELKASAVRIWPSWSLTVPNVPCGVESCPCGFCLLAMNSSFLMYRVELKACSSTLFRWSWTCVPNVPCGVESLEDEERLKRVREKVPNVPCGVESSTKNFHGTGGNSRFLMYRVELKEPQDYPTEQTRKKVPNVPCGVESIANIRPSFGHTLCS